MINRVYFSLPKTQPTRDRSSTKQKNNQVDNFQYEKLDTCPETRQLNITKNTKSKQQLYIHKINVDYGRLKQPNCQKLLKQLKVQNLMETKKILINSVDQNYLKTEKKITTNFRENLENNNFFQKKENKSYKREAITKLTKIKAYQNLDIGNTIRRSRIIKTVTVGRKLQTKVINYPNHQGYLKLCNFN